MTTRSIKKWNALSDQQKAEFGNMYITHDTNLRAWCKDFKDLSELKQKRVLDSMPTYTPANCLIGFGIM
jgi:succinate dehydrogenase flavin-adding protein (antitoxin of CptAB toxin-antitoxin module)